MPMPVAVSPSMSMLKAPGTCASADLTASRMCGAVKSYMATVRRLLVPCKKPCNVGQPASGLQWQVMVMAARTGSRRRFGGGW